MHVHASVAYTACRRRLVEPFGKLPMGCALCGSAPFNDYRSAESSLGVIAEMRDGYRGYNKLQPLKGISVSHLKESVPCTEESKCVTPTRISAVHLRG